MFYMVGLLLLLFLMYPFVWLRWVLVAACEIEFPDQGWNLGPLHWEHKVLAIGPPVKSLNVIFLFVCFDEGPKEHTFLSEKLV